MKNFQNNNEILLNPRKIAPSRGSLLRSYGASGILKHWNSCDIPISLYNRYVVRGTLPAGGKS